MPDIAGLEPLSILAGRVGAILRERRQTVAVAESSAGGLVSAALLAIPGASAFFLGGAVVYSRRAGKALLGLTAEDMAGMRAETEPYASFIAGRIRGSHRATWGIAESGAAGPSGSPYGDAPGHVRGRRRRGCGQPDDRNRRCGPRVEHGCLCAATAPAVPPDAAGAGSPSARLLVRLHPRRLDHLPHFSVSAARWVRSASGVTLSIGTASVLSSAKRCLTMSSCSAARRAVLSFSITAGGVPLGA